MTNIEEARAAVRAADERVAGALARCKAVLSALRSKAPVEQLPQVAAEVMAQLDGATKALGEMHRKAEAALIEAHALRYENTTLLEYLEAMAAMPTPDDRAKAARNMLDSLKRPALPAQPGHH